MNMKALLGAVVALALAVGGAALLVASFAKPAPPPPVPVPEAIKDQMETNPFDLTAPGPRPKVDVEETHFDFGVMALGGSQSHDYVFKNEGEGPMKLAKGPMMCKCTMPAVPDQEIKPGESINITLTWTPVESTHDFSKEAVIWTNDPEKPKINLSIKGQVFEDPMTYPSEFGVGDIAWNKEHETEVILVSTVEEKFTVDNLEVSNPEWMKVTSEPADLTDLIAKNHPNPVPKAGYTIKLKILPNDTVGPFGGWVKLKTNLKENPKVVDVIGVRFGPIAVHGSDFQAALSMVDMKRFKSAEGRETKLFVYLEPFGPELQVTEVVSGSGHLSATLHKEKTSEGAKKDFYTLHIKAPPGLTPGTLFTAEDPDTLTLKTNHPQVPELKFILRYVVN